MSLHYLTEHETRSLLELPLYLATVQAGFRVLPMIIWTSG